MASETGEILSRLDSIQADLNYLKERLADTEALSTDDRKAIRAAKADYKAGRTTRLA